VPARIAHCPEPANDVGVGGLRLLAILVALAAGVSDLFVVLGMLDVVHNAEANAAPAGIAPFVALAIAAPAVVGLLIALRRPSNPIAWILLIGGLTAIPALGFFLSDGWTLQTARALWPLMYAWPIAVAYVFPDGRFLSSRWRRFGIAAAACFVIFMTLGLFDPTRFDDDPSIPNPMGGNAFGEAVLDTGIWIPFWLGILASLVAGAVAIYLRLRRSSGVERLQTLWLAWAACLIPLGLLLCATSWAVFSWVDTVVLPFLLVMQAAVAAAIGIAVARYRLYAIERLINRTVVYAALTVLLGATYVGITVGLGVVAGHGSAWVTALATLAVAVAFRPLRARIQMRVDRRFDRASFEAVRRVRAFEEEVREGTRAPEEIAQVLAEALRDPTAELLFWLPASETYAGASGEASPAAKDGLARTEIRHGGNLTAVLLHDPALGERRNALESILSTGALSIEIARLRVEVRRQLAEVEASRRRIVEAGYEERRRLERDLHDGAQQRLVTLGIVLRRLQRSLPLEAQMLAPALDAAVDEVGAAVADLRTIAAGVRPPRLDDGLTAALRDLARTSPVPVDLEAAVGRVAASVEAAAYFVACEGLTNAVKHASASRVSLRAVRANGTLFVTVSDDGVGGAVARRGSGLAGLRDRVSAHGGALEIASPRGRGTRIEVAIPCES
jgi:signal transduction histidine kinase